MINLLHHVLLLYEQKYTPCASMYWPNISHCRTTTVRCYRYRNRVRAGSCASPARQCVPCRTVERNEGELRQVDLMDLFEDLLPHAGICRRLFLGKELI